MMLIAGLILILLSELIGREVQPSDDCTVWDWRDAATGIPLVLGIVLELVGIYSLIWGHIVTLLQCGVHP